MFLLLLSNAAAGPQCRLATIGSVDGALAAPLTTPAAVLVLPVGSIVRAGGGACTEGVPVEVLGVDASLPVPPDARSATVGTRGCMPPAALGDLGEWVRLVRAVGGLPAGQQWCSIPPELACDATEVRDADGNVIPLGALAAAQARSGPDAVTAANLEEEYERLFHVPAEGVVQVNPFGRVALPLPHALSAAERDAEIERESLTTPAQREKAVIATGPTRRTVAGEVAIYDHFLGSDVPGTDVWARPETILHFLRLADGWFAACAADSDPSLCTLHVGDLAYVDGRRPDPLGHKDHADGACVDLRLFRTDRSRYEAWWNRPDDRTGRDVYDAERTIAFLLYARAHAPVGDIFFNDPAVIAAVPGVRPLPGHDDHVHLCLGE